MSPLPQLTLVIGGAASGKSAYAETLARNASDRRVYIATAQAFDTEMEAKIARHQAARAQDGWNTIEAPFDVAGAVGKRELGEIILLDCATFWLTNLLLADRDWRSETDLLTTALISASCPVIVVTNETGQGIVPENDLARRFRQAQGELNQILAAEADLVVTVIAGLPLPLKGTAP